jgi:hypothetical protein
MQRTRAQTITGRVVFRDSRIAERAYHQTMSMCALADVLSHVPDHDSGKERRISRWEHEAVLEAVQARLDRIPDKMRVRRQTVEHPFGTIKSWMGATHSQMKTLSTSAPKWRCTSWPTT